MVYEGAIGGMVNRLNSGDALDQLRVMMMDVLDRKGL